MKTLLKTLLLITVCSFAISLYAADRYSGDSDVSSMVEINPPPINDARISYCKSSTWHYVKMGSNIKPSGYCRVVNYYDRDGRFMGSTNIPLDTSYKVEYYPEVR